MKIGVLKETEAGETRVALVPETVGRLVKAGQQVVIQKDAGLASSFSDATYEAVGATVAPDAASLLSQVDLVVKVQKPSPDEIRGMREGEALVTFIQPVLNPALVRLMVEKKVTSFSMDAVPRISRAQVMDALSSMSTVAGYKAVLLSAVKQGRFFPMLTTAAGTIAPARCVVLGAGVAGLQAIATARRLGAVVEAFDVRPAVKEQVESLGAKFIEAELKAGAEDAGGYAKAQSEDEAQRTRDTLRKPIKDADVVISTALIPGKPAPLLISSDMVAEMKPGSVIIDLAAEMGGNCQLTKAGEDVSSPNGVIISGVLNLPASMPIHASQMYSRNMLSLLNLLIKDGNLNLDFNDEIIKGACITHNGEILHGPSKAAVEAAS